MCEFCNGKRQKIENGYTYGNAMIVGNTLTGTCPTTIVETNMDWGGLT